MAERFPGGARPEDAAAERVAQIEAEEAGAAFRELYDRLHNEDDGVRTAAREDLNRQPEAFLELYGPYSRDRDSVAAAGVPAEAAPAAPEHPAPGPGHSAEAGRVSDRDWMRAAEVGGKSADEIARENGARSTGALLATFKRLHTVIEHRDRGAVRGKAERELATLTAEGRLLYDAFAARYAGGATAEAASTTLDEPLSGAARRAAERTRRGGGDGGSRERGGRRAAGDGDPSGPSRPARAERARSHETLHIESGSAERVGLMHIDSEDRSVRDDKLKLYGSIDGMGGYAGGEIAAESIRTSATAYLSEHQGEFTPDNGADLMRGMFRAAHGSVTEAAATAVADAKAKAGGDPAREAAAEAFNEMGAVAAIGHVFEYEGKTYVAVGIVGDAKFIKYNPDETGRVESEEECLPPPHPEIVTNAIQPGHELKLNQFDVYELKDGDRLAFLTDGVTGDKPAQRLKPGEVEHALSLPTAQESADDFLEVTSGMDRKIADDATAVVVRASAGEVAAAESGEDDARAALARAEGFSSPEAMDAHFARMRTALADPAHPEHRLAELDLTRRSGEFGAAYAAFDTAATAAEAAGEGAAEPEPAAPEAEPGSPEARIAELTAENARLHERITELEERIDNLTRTVEGLRAALETHGVPDPTRPEAGRTGAETSPSLPHDRMGYAREEAQRLRAKIEKVLELEAEFIPGDELDERRRYLTGIARGKAVDHAIAMYREHGPYDKYVAERESKVARTEEFSRRYKEEHPDSPETGGVRARVKRMLSDAADRLSFLRREDAIEDGEDDDAVDFDDESYDRLGEWAERFYAANPDLRPGARSAETREERSERRRETRRRVMSRFMGAAMTAAEAAGFVSSVM
jgi:serine/threonine protein phosphatase PrpC